MRNGIVRISCNALALVLFGYACAANGDSVSARSSGSAGPSTGKNPGAAGSSSGALSIRVQGNKFVDGFGHVVQLRGVNFSGIEFVAMDGWNPSDASGGQGGQPDGPNWAAIRNWHANIVRLPLNEASWLDYSCTDTNGAVRDPDPGHNYRSSIARLVTQANAAGLYVILDLHVTAPGTACPRIQTQMADADHSLAFWTSVAKLFKSNPAVMFELFNEPFLNFEFTGNAWSYMMQGTKGSFTGFPAQSGGGPWKNVKQSWAIASYQAMIDTVRATSATNVVLVGSMQYAQDLSGWLANRPTDPQNQMAVTWHPYPTFGTTWGTYAYSQPNFAPAVFTDVQNIRAAGFPVIATETGDQNTPGTLGAPLISTVTRFADQNGVSLLGWTWDVWGSPSNVLVKDVDGTPTDGYGQVFHSWMVTHAQ